MNKALSFHTIMTTVLPISPVDESTLDDSAPLVSLSSPPAITTASRSELPIRDTVHYWESVVLMVGEGQFQVPRYHLEKHSPYFRSLLASRGEQTTESCGDAAPVRLDERVTASEFETFLDMLYPSYVPVVELTRSQEEWMAILKISTIMQFFRIRQLAIQALTSMNIDSFTRIKLARDYCIPQWLRTGYAQLVKQLSTLTVDEVESLGYLTAIRIFRVREQMAKIPFWSGSSGNILFSTSHWDDGKVRDAIEEEFIGEMVEADKQSTVYDTMRSLGEESNTFEPANEVHEKLTVAQKFADTTNTSEPANEVHKNLTVAQKFAEAIRLAREINMVKGMDMREREKEGILNNLRRSGDKYWGGYIPSEHSFALDVSPLSTHKAADAVEERMLYLLNPLAQHSGDEGGKALEVTIPKKFKGGPVKNAVGRMLATRNLTSTDHYLNPRIMIISLPRT
ncbi:hypothetical protein D9758_006327 [Tetrapyrgos nigripes]|uniref:BTB domain-containing protein n=1 Tax=Tetrapyrgos nigripes TaxID=182062 RepID=A0A8H5D8N4_9AGAR|nr:hypothetical protein D9758_006327 [Tetrapyrgos nigripes]